jgi:hypothetical protein
MFSLPSFIAKHRHAFGVAVTLLVFAGVFFFDPLPFSSPVPPAQHVALSTIDTRPVRQTDLTPRYQVAVFDYRCSECHAIIPAPTSDRYRTVTQHQEIRLEHGINTSCLNCHHPTNRDTFVDDVGGEIPWNQPQLLCARCHGPVYRDWQHGSHGRTNGYWDTSRGDQTRRRCIECHDPHRPPFVALHPAPGPRTLRLGPRKLAEHDGPHNPLKLGGAAEQSPASETSNEGH